MTRHKLDVSGRASTPALLGLRLKAQGSGQLWRQPDHTRGCRKLARQGARPGLCPQQPSLKTRLPKGLHSAPREQKGAAASLSQESRPAIQCLMMCRGLFKHVIPTVTHLTRTSLVLPARLSHEAPTAPTRTHSGDWVMRNTGSLQNRVQFKQDLAA